MAPATVLLIDSDEDSIAIYSLILKHHGFAVLHASDPETGLRLAVEGRPDVVVSELILPPIGGMSMFERLSSEERLAGTPLILLDSWPGRLGESAATLVPQNRLTKPCEPSRLLHEVQRVLDLPLLQLKSEEFGGPIR